MISKVRAALQSWRADSDRSTRFSRMLGLTFVGGGFVVIGKAWDGAASINFATGQIPYLLSGGFLGLGLIVVGCTLLLLSSARAEKQMLGAKFDEMATLLSRNLSRLQYSSNGSSHGEQVVVAGATYHRPECNILPGKSGLTTVALEQALGEGLAPCRVCDAPRAKDQIAAASGS